MPNVDIYQFNCHCL